MLGDTYGENLGEFHHSFTMFHLDMFLFEEKGGFTLPEPVPLRNDGWESRILSFWDCQFSAPNESKCPDAARYLATVVQNRYAVQWDPMGCTKQYQYGEKNTAKKLRFATNYVFSILPSQAVLNCMLPTSQHFLASNCTIW